jgi:transcription elongation factor Elf1
MSLEVLVKNRPLEKRVYRYKNAATNFFCPLCRTERAVTTSPRLSLKNYAQITLTSIVLGAALYPLMEVRSFFVFFVVWTVFELTVRSDFKKQVPCPHCGFDATSYKKDVRVARQEVKDFWAQKNSTSDNVVGASTAKQA